MLYDEELPDLYRSSRVVRMVKSRRLWWAGRIARVRETRSAYRTFFLFYEATYWTKHRSLYLPIILLNTKVISKVRRFVLLVVNNPITFLIYCCFNGYCSLKHLTKRSLGRWLSSGLLHRVALKRWWTSTRLHGPTTQKTVVIFMPRGPGRWLGRPKRKWERNIKTHFMEICEDENLVEQAVDRAQLRDLAMLNLRVLLPESRLIN
jgi:hypothetical protein